MRVYLFLFILLGSFSLGAAEFVKNIEDIKREIDLSLLKYHLKDPTKNPLPGASFGSFLSYPAPSLMGEHCLEFDSQKTRIEVIMVLQNLFPTNPPLLAPEPKEEHNPNTETIIFLVENNQPIDYEKDSSPSYEVSFPSEFMEDKIKFAHKSLEFKYSTGYRLNQSSSPQGAGVNTSDLEWLRKGNLKIDVLPSLRIDSEVLISESLQSQEGPIRGNIISNLFSLEGIKFATNYVNVKVDASAQVSKKAKVNLSLNVDHQSGESSAALLSNIDFAIPNGARLMVFSNVKSPLNISGRVLESKTDAGIELKTSKGIRFSGEVNDLGSGVPQIRGTISLPADFSPRE